MANPWYLQMSPESYSRYILLARILELHLGSQPSKILELGGRGSYIWEIFRDKKLPYELTVLDILPDEKPQNYRYIQGDAVKTGLANHSYDAVVSTDTLEHISADRKEAFIQEAVRLARRLVVIAAPFESGAVAQAEQRANNFHKELTGKAHPWLTEHEAIGRPRSAEIESTIQSLGLKYSCFGSNRLDIWLPSLVLNMLPTAVTVDHNKIADLNEFYNNNLFSMGDFTEPTYRQFYVVYTDNHLKIHSRGEYTQGINKNDLANEYKQRAIQLLSNEIDSRYSRLISASRDIDVKLEQELHILEKAKKLSALTIKSNHKMADYLILVKKGVKKPKKALKYVFYRLRSR